MQESLIWKDMNIKISGLLPVQLFVGGLLWAGTISASPTDNEFIPCKKLAVRTLDFCLNQNGSECWEKSKADHDSCSKDVIYGHSRDARKYEEEKRQAEKEARKELEARQKN
ncbi:hypothetical protein [Pseudomaricurvus sp. HS19]|uniref:hypothetical protein n=1 Tax=Pseudomaricurvus sp. HS19 TaxID=2692626 RepID=UPI0013697875|nr:hypothetical protein [Pseudomaricurvus sp. HS19]MYM61797.1 hypothetical protein [Pseudomaricurvus sp. HS19]